MEHIQYFNYHTHTYRCKHAKGTDEEYVLAAIEAGYKILGFSDHAPYRDYPSEKSHMDFEQLDDYIQSVEHLKEKYRDRIEIHLGLESEYYPFNHDERVELKNRVEYLILGQHFSSPDENRVSYFLTNTDEQILEYGKQVCQALDSGLFLYLCHPDVYLNRQNSFTEACEEVAHMIARKVCEKNIPVEINTRGVIRGKSTFDGEQYYCYPNRKFWSIMAQYPIRCIYGIDAHSPENLSDISCLEEAERELKDLGLNFIKEPIV